MKELTGIKLINWHYFTDVTLNFSGSTLLTGDNASGKSTILDAIQLVLVADLRHIKFNVSAHDETDRTLRGYIRCKTGEDNSFGGYLRQGDFTSYVVLEFYDTEKNSSFLLGCVIDAYGDNLTEDRKFFKLENSSLKDHYFRVDGKSRNIKGFRTFMRGHKGFELYNSVEKYRQDLLQKMGSLSNRFFSLFVKAIGFKPITDIRKFVYDYVLEEKQVEIESMQQNFQYYRDLEELVTKTQEKISHLENVVKKGDQIKRLKEKSLVQEYLILRAEAEDCKEKLDLRAGEKDKKENSLKKEQDNLSFLKGRLEDNQEQLKKSREILGRDALYQKVKSLEADIKRLAGEEKDLKEEKERLIKYSREDASNLTLLLERGKKFVFPEEKDFLDSFIPLQKKLGEGIIPGGDENEDDADALANTRKQIGQAEKVLQEFKERISNEKYKLDVEEKELQEKLTAVQEHLKKLEKKRHVYDERVMALRKILRDKLKEETGQDIEPAVFCELLEIPHEKWQNAVEGFLNTQRFDLLVEPRYFDFCLKIYEKYKREEGIYGVGLVNTSRVLSFLDRAQPGSLAEEVEAKNDYARGYINQLLGNLIKCDSEKELKKHRRSITPTCMTYLNNAARQINFKVYEIPYIGERAFVRQIEIKKKRRSQLEERLAEVKAEKTFINELISLSGNSLSAYSWLKENLEVVGKLKLLLKEKDEKQKDLEAIDRESINSLKEKIQKLEEEKSRLEEEKEKSHTTVVGLEKDLEYLENDIIQLQSQEEGCREILVQFCNSHPNIEEPGRARYQNEFLRISPEQISINFTHNKKSLDSRIQNLISELGNLQRNYNDLFQFGGRIDGEDTREYQEEFNKLVKSELPQYREKIEATRKEAEQQFKEHFVYRLREYIEDARREFKLLNSALDTVQFGQDRYSFINTPSENLRKFYDMIMDTSLLEGGSLFSDYFRERHAEAMDELFDKVLYAHQERLEELAEELTDYRNYLEYDIRITHSSGETSLFSRVCREKSGGETQTPFYVAMLASFVQLYRLRDSRHTLRLILFDEAFNRMDADRIETSTRFIDKLGLQAIVAVPTEKCEDIAPHLSTTLLVLREGRYSWVEDFRQLTESVEGEKESSGESGESAEQSVKAVGK